MGKLIAYTLIFPLYLVYTPAYSQVKILFDCTKAETSGNADWVIDADLHNIFWESNDQIGTGTASNPQQYPTPAQNTVITSTPETYWEGSLSNWGIDCVNYGYEVETLPPSGLITYGDTSNPQDLSNYKVYVMDEPNIRFSDTEKVAILNFVKNGGGLFMISDHTGSDRNNDGWDSPHIWNDFLETATPPNPFGITFNLYDFSTTSNNVTPNPDDSILHGPYGSVTGLIFSGATIMRLWPDSNSSVTGDIFMAGVSALSRDSAMFAHARFGSGRVAAISDSSPEDDGTGNPACQLYSSYATDMGGSHRKLIMNATIWLAESAWENTGIVDELPENELTVYPNPSTGKFIFRMTDNFHPDMIQVYDVTGKIVVQTNAASSNQNIIEVDLKNLTPGLYTSILSNDAMTVRRKLIKTN